MTESLFRIRLDVAAENTETALAVALGTGVQGVELRDAIANARGVVGRAHVHSEDSHAWVRPAY